MTLSPHIQPLDRYTLRLLVPAELDQVLDLREQVLAGLPLPDLYVREAGEPAFVARHLGPAGATFGVFDGTALVAYAMLGLPPAQAPAPLARWLPGHAGDAARYAELASCMVRQSHRGQGLQRALLAARFALAQARGRTHCVAATSLQNHASRRNLMRAGMCIAWVGSLTGLQRQLLVVELQQPWTFADTPRETVHCLDFARQCALTKQGLFGVEAQAESQPDAIVFVAKKGLSLPAAPGPHACPR